MALGYGRTSTNNFSTAKFIVDTNGIQNGATHTTIAAAITSAGAGPADIFIRPGTYTENLTDPGNLNFVAYGGGQLQQVQIVGKITQTGAVSSTWSNIYFKTNSDNALSIGGSGANQSVFNNCFFFCGSTGIAINNSSASPIFRNCTFSQRTASTAHFSITSCSISTFNYCTFLNDSGGADGTNTVATGTVEMNYCRLSVQYTTSSSGSYQWTECYRLTSGNSTVLTTAGTGTTYLSNCTLQSGTSATISVGSGTTVVAQGLNIISSNSNPITGAGTFTSSPVIFSSTGYGINTTTKTLHSLQANEYFSNRITAPDAGAIGELISASASTGSLTSLTIANITSISLTAGIWDICGQIQFATTGSASGNMQWVGAMSLANNDLTAVGDFGQNQITGTGVMPINAVGNVGIFLGPTRVVLSATTTLYLNCRAWGTLSNVTATGKFRGMRVA